MIIRTALSQAAAELTEFNINMARETEGVELIPEVISAGVKAMIENPQMGFYLVVELDNGIQASLMVTTEWSDWRNGMFWWIQSVYVRPEYRRQGLYRELYERVKELAEQESSVCGFRLYVENWNSVAQKTYASLGMTETAYRMFEELKPDLEYKK
ncbi:MAG: GNAT family N-acetyltransferase [Gammaproteobacteria bacterium]|nr:GNAT family N-acetyltransferase [Gammaproteobacteria bacterium]